MPISRAYATGCVPSNPDLVPLVSPGHPDAELRLDRVTLPMVPAGQDSGLPAPISHLSWAADNDHLAVSTLSVQDNEGWALVIVDTSQAQVLPVRDGHNECPGHRQPYLAGQLPARRRLHAGRQSVCEPSLLRWRPGAQHVAADVGGRPRPGPRPPDSDRIRRTSTTSAWTSAPTGSGCCTSRGRPVRVASRRTRRASSPRA